MVEDNWKPSWKQLIPIYGMWRMLKDDAEGKDSLINVNYERGDYFVSMCASVYHAFVSGIPIVAGIFYGLETLLK